MAPSQSSGGTILGFRVVVVKPQPIAQWSPFVRHIQRETANERCAISQLAPGRGHAVNLPWQNDGNSFPFGSVSRPADLLSHAGEIKTYSERIEDAEANTNLYRLLIDAKKIVFLGFAFHDENMELMKSGSPNALRHVFATARGISDSDREVIQEQINDVFGKKALEIPIQL